MKQVYLDNNATTKPDVRLNALFCQINQEVFGNPSSIHSYGQKARNCLIEARQTLADICKVGPQEILFTASATEALNLILRGFFLRGFFATSPRGHIITSQLEHAAVFQTCQELQKQGVEVTYLEVGEYGAPTLEQVQKAMRPDTRLIALMAANNETGVVTDVEAIAQHALEHEIAFVVDGVALFGKAPLPLHPGISAMVFSGHKFHTPKGAAFAMLRKGLKILPSITGGEQEYGLRAGTENLAAIACLAEGGKLTQAELSESMAKMKELRDYFEKRVQEALPNVKVNGTAPRVVNVSNLQFVGFDGEALLMYLDRHGIAASLGSACTAGALEPSRVLLSMGLSRKEAMSSLRFSLSRYTTKDEIDYVVSTLRAFTGRGGA